MIDGQQLHHQIAWKSDFDLGLQLRLASRAELSIAIQSAKRKAQSSKLMRVPITILKVKAILYISSINMNIEKFVSGS